MDYVVTIRLPLSFGNYEFATAHCDIYHMGVLPSQSGLFKLKFLILTKHFKVIWPTGNEKDLKRVSVQKPVMRGHFQYL